MDKLELNHIAPYLPYGLNLEVEDSVFCKKHIIEMTSIGQIYRYEGCPIGINGTYRLHTVKPVLRPMSDYKFPERRLFINDYDTDEIVEAIKEDTLFRLRYNLVLELIEAMFDVFGLIDRGLAIDVNTVDHG